MKRFIFRVFLALLVVTNASALVAQDAGSERNSVEIGERLSIHSEILDEERAYWVHLPASYDQAPYSPARYPVLYLLDGNAHFHSVTGALNFMSAGINGNMQVPEMIVVAIPNTDRTRDLTPTATSLAFDGSEIPDGPMGGGGAEFLRFIRDELMPRIEADYRTRPYTVFVGHSLGGLIALHALVNAPGMFDAHIAIDPSLWWDDRKLEKQARTHFSGTDDREGAVFISLANNKPPPGVDNIMKIAGEAFAASMAGANTEHFRTDHKFYEREDHGSVPLISLYDGLLHIFDGYKPSLAALFEDPSGLQPHFRAVSERLGQTFLPPEPTVNQLGYALLAQEPDKAVQFFEANVENYPDSFNAWDSLGDGLAAQGETDRAIESYQRSLELNPENENARTRIEELKAGGTE
ncbi:MAG: alpha/beta fold hydrolase [Gemmatimonadota bacterium]|nr:alpha/beta fold hydrolase [Gemmatimonadota bacterium]